MKTHSMEPKNGYSKHWKDHSKAAIKECKKKCQETSGCKGIVLYDKQGRYNTRCHFLKALPTSSQIYADKNAHYYILNR